MLNQKEFKPQQSTRIASRIAPDNDTWTEYLAVVDMLNPITNVYQLQVRSFFESSTTQNKAWDEPPSGAKNIVWANEGMREMANVQLQDLSQVGKPSTSGDQNSEKKKHKKGLWVRRLSLPFGKKTSGKNSKAESNGIEQKDRPMYEYNKGSDTHQFVTFSGESKEATLSTNDINLQKALQVSMGLHEHECECECEYQPDAPHSPEVAHRYPPQEESLEHLQEDEAMAMAKALSLSESEACGGIIIDIGGGGDRVSDTGMQEKYDYCIDNDGDDRKLPADPFFVEQKDP
jgi:hypothetical protein